MDVRRKFIYLLQIPAIGIELVFMVKDFDKSFFENPWFVGSVLGIFFVTLNFLFLKELYGFIRNKHNKREVFWELLFVVVTGISNIFIFATTFYFFGIQDQRGTLIQDFISSLYFSVATWTTLGYGDFSPIPQLRLIASFEALIGYTYMAILIGLFLSVVKIEITEDG